jgi:hypothetical protein
MARPNESGDDERLRAARSRHFPRVGAARHRFFQFRQKLTTPQKVWPAAGSAAGHFLSLGSN